MTRQSTLSTTPERAGSSGGRVTWTPRRQRVLCEFLVHNTEGLRANKARAYQRFVSENEHIANLDVKKVRNKHESLRSAYQRGRNLLRQTGEGTTAEGSLRDRLLGICPEYEYLNQHWGSRVSQGVAMLLEEGLEETDGPQSPEVQEASPTPQQASFDDDEGLQDNNLARESELVAPDNQPSERTSRRRVASASTEKRTEMRLQIALQREQRKALTEQHRLVLEQRLLCEAQIRLAELQADKGDN